MIAFVVLAAAGSIVWLRLSHSQAGSPSGVQPGGGQGTGGTAPADPFAGTAAAKWADGESGIVIPSAKPVGNFTTAQVKGAYEATRRLLIAANLNEQTLLGGAPTTFAGLLTRQQRDEFLAGLNKAGVNKSGYPLSTRKWVASFAPGSAEFIGNVIKAHGVMSAQTARLAGGVVLAIQAPTTATYIPPIPVNGRLALPSRGPPSTRTHQPHRCPVAVPSAGGQRVPNRWIRSRRYDEPVTEAIKL